MSYIATNTKRHFLPDVVSSLSIVAAASRLALWISYSATLKWWDMTPASRELRTEPPRQPQPQRTEWSSLPELSPLVGSYFIRPTRSVPFPPTSPLAHGYTMKRFSPVSTSSEVAPSYAEVTVSNTRPSRCPFHHLQRSWDISRKSLSSHRIDMNSPPLGQSSSVDITGITQQVSFMQLPIKMCSNFFGRESTFEESTKSWVGMDQQQLSDL